MRWCKEFWCTLALAILPLLLISPLHAAQVSFQNGGQWSGAAARSQPQKLEGSRQIQDGVPAEDILILQDGRLKQYGGQGQDGFHQNDSGDETERGHRAQSGQAENSGQKQDGGRGQDKEYIRVEIHAQNGGKGQTGDLYEKGHHIYPRIKKRAADTGQNNQSYTTGGQLYLEQCRVVTKCCPPGEALVSQNPPSCSGTGSAALNFTGNSNCGFP
jgi:hypothetical protein